MFQMFQDFKSTPVAFQLFSLVMHCGFSTPQGGDPFGPGGAAEGKDTWPKFPVQTTFGLAHSELHREISRKSRRLMKLGVVKTWWMWLEYAVSAHGHAQHSTPRKVRFRWPSPSSFRWRQGRTAVRCFMLLLTQDVIPDFSLRTRKVAEGRILQRGSGKNGREERRNGTTWRD